MRALLIFLESLGVGRMAQGDGAPTPDTLARLFDKTSGLELPTLFSLGLGEIGKGRVFDPPCAQCTASYGRMIQRSAGSDAVSGLWELAGVVCDRPFAATDALPPEFLEAVARESGGEFLRNPVKQWTAFEGEPASQISGLVREHLQSGRPILTFSADSLLHVTAHESVVSAARLAQFCRILRRHADTWRIARVTGQLLTGKLGAWQPAGAVLHQAMVPPRTILHALSDKGLPVETVGEIHEAFGHSGITRAHPTGSQAGSLEVIERLWKSPQNGMIFANLPHLAGKDATEFARALEAFDTWLAGFLNEIESDNLLILVGSNGRGAATLDPRFPRQEVPVLVRYGGRTAPLGLRESLADVAATLGAFFSLEEGGRPWAIGEPLITFHRPRGFSGP